MSGVMTTQLEKRLTGASGLFGTSGIRADISRDVYVNFWMEIAQAVGTRLAPGAKVCIATDTRVSRGAVKAAVVSGLLAAGVDVSDLGILPTPVLARLTGDMGFDSGVMITASHNPPQFNGIKLFNGNSQGYSKEQEVEVERIYRDKSFRTNFRGNFLWLQGAKERYFRFILSEFTNEDFSQNMRVVVDSGNGAASGLASKLFSFLDFDVIPFNDVPDGLFPGRDPEPGKDTLEGTVEFLRQQNADLAVCFDGDADRVVFCDKDGFLGFNEMIAYISRLMVRKTGKRKVAATVETGRMLDLVLSDLGVEVIRGSIGSSSVAYLAEEHDAALGVEPAGIYIMPEIGYYPDSIFAALTLLSRINEIGEIREFFRDKPRLYLRKEKLSCPNWLKQAVIDRARDCASLFTANELNALDGLRFEFDDAWLLIRPSGTEPAIRITVESGSEQEAELLLNKAARLTDSIIRDLIG